LSRGTNISRYQKIRRNLLGNCMHIVCLLNTLNHGDKWDFPYHIQIVNRVQSDQFVFLDQMIENWEYVVQELDQEFRVRTLRQDQVQPVNLDHSQCCTRFLLSPKHFFMLMLIITNLILLSPKHFFHLQTNLLLLSSKNMLTLIRISNCLNLIYFCSLIKTVSH
jgi:hypothetical protein